MSTIDFSCPQCGHTMKLPVALIGKKGKCPKCGMVNEVTYPAGTQQTAPVTQQQPAPAQQQIPPQQPAAPQNPLGGMPQAPAGPLGGIPNPPQQFQQPPAMPTNPLGGMPQAPAGPLGGIPSPPQQFQQPPLNAPTAPRGTYYIQSEGKIHGPLSIEEIAPRFNEDSLIGNSQDGPWSRLATNSTYQLLASTSNSTSTTAGSLASKSNGATDMDTIMRQIKDVANYQSEDEIKSKSRNKALLLGLISVFLFTLEALFPMYFFFALPGAVLCIWGFSSADDLKLKHTSNLLMLIFVFHGLGVLILKTVEHFAVLNLLHVSRNTFILILSAVFFALEVILMLSLWNQKEAKALCNRCGAYLTINLPTGNTIYHCGQCGSHDWEIVSIEGEAVGGIGNH